MDERERKELARKRLEERYARSSSGTRSSSSSHASSTARSTSRSASGSQDRSARRSSSASGSASSRTQRNSAQAARSERSGSAKSAGQKRSAQARGTQTRSSRTAGSQARPSKASASRARTSTTRNTPARSSQLITLPIVGAIDKRIAIAALVGIVLFLVVIVMIVRGCTAPATSGGSSAASASASSEASQPSVEPEPTDPYTISDIEDMIGTELTQVLVERAETNEDYQWIITHVSAYDIEDYEVKQKLFQLAAKDPNAIDYVRHFPERYPTEDQSDDPALALDDGLAGSKFITKVPHLYQWDERWAYCVYSSTTFGLTGCGPTCMAMVSQALAGSDITPWRMGQLANEMGYMTQFNGTDGNFLYAEAAREGISIWEAIPDGEIIKANLEAGAVIVANLAPGYFTQGGHYFVLAGLDENGQVIVNDPYSVLRSSQTWDADFIASESMSIYIFG